MMKPTEPDCSGRQYANDAATPDKISASFDSYTNEIATDRPMHENTTPGMGAFNFSGKQYSDDWMGGNSNYGVAVGTPSASRETTDVNSQSTERGKES
jgi:hypothetical protein